MTTATEEKKVSPQQLRREEASKISLEMTRKFINREFIGKVEGLTHPVMGQVELHKYTIEQGRENEQVLELTNHKGLGAVLHRAFFDLWRAYEDEVINTLELAEFSAEMANDLRTKGYSNKARFIETSRILEAIERQKAIIEKIQTALFVANN